MAARLADLSSVARIAPRLIVTAKQDRSPIPSLGNISDARTCSSGVNIKGLKSFHTSGGNPAVLIPVSYSSNAFTVVLTSVPHK